MTASQNATQLMQKGARALESARLLLDAGDADGARNRAYYAMFDAARAALASETSPEDTRTHNGLIAAFRLRLVKTGRLPKELGRMLNRAEEVRLLADYTAAWSSGWATTGDAAPTQKSAIHRARVVIRPRATNLTAALPVRRRAWRDRLAPRRESGNAPAGVPSPAPDPSKAGRRRQRSGRSQPSPYTHRR